MVSGGGSGGADQRRRLGSSAPVGHGSSASPRHSQGRPTVGASRATPSPGLAVAGAPHCLSLVGANRSQELRALVGSAVVPPARACRRSLCPRRLCAPRWLRFPPAEGCSSPTGLPSPGLRTPTCRRVAAMRHPVDEARGAPAGPPNLVWGKGMDIGKERRHRERRSRRVHGRGGTTGPLWGPPCARGEGAGGGAITGVATRNYSFRCGREDMMRFG
ncbi:unnamed protein product [Urochloa humidicola]